MPRVENGRRPAGYYFRARARANERQLSMLSDEQFEELGVVNQIRQQVRAWHEDEQDRAKYAAARRWCEAVTNWGQMGRWVFDHCGGPGSVRAVLALYGQ